MTETEWFASTDVRALSRLLDPHLTERRLRLFACHCLRSLGNVLPQESDASLKVVERALDKQIRWNEAKSRVIQHTTPRAPTWANPNPIEFGHVFRLPSLLIAPRPAEAAAQLAAFCAMHPNRPPLWEGWRGALDDRYYAGEHPEFQSVDTSQFLPAFHDIVGNPFGLIQFERRWRTSTAVGLAQGMHDARDFAAMPILADALQDAGCEDDAILTHCRGDGPHVRGCWVVDLVLGKA